MLKNILILFCCCSIYSCLAQDLQFNIQHFDIEDGLEARDVFSVQQDERGIIWLGTDSGLHSFDGIDFKLVQDSTHQLSSGKITGIKKTKKGKFWIEKRSGFPILFDPMTKRIESNNEKFNEIKKMKILFPRGNSSNVFFRDEKGQIFYFNEKEKILPFGNIKISPLDYARPSPWNTLLINKADSLQLIEVNPKGDVLRKVPIRRSQHSSYDRKQNFLITFHRGIKKSTRVDEKIFSVEKDGSVKPISLKINNRALVFGDLNLDPSKKYHECYIKLTIDSQENFWLVVNGNFWLFDKNGDFKANLTTRLTSLIKNSNLSINHLFIDRDDRCWVSTVFGLFMIWVKENPFDHYLVDNNKYSTRGIAELPNNRLLIFSYGGTQILDKSTKVSELRIDLDGLGLFQDKGDTIILGAHGTGLRHLVDDRFTFTNNSDPALGGVFIRIPYRDQKTNQLFLGTENGLYIFANDSIQEYSKLNEYQDLQKYKITHFYQNQEGIWIGSMNGIYLLDPQKGIVEHFKFPNPHINHIHEDSAGDFWIASAGGGLIHWQRSKNKIRQLTTKNGLSHNLLCAVYEDENEFLWIPSNDGLMRFDKKNDGVVIFNTSDGISHQEFNRHSHYQAEDGRLYFGGINGVNAFYPSELNLVENKVPFIVTQLLQFDNRKGRLIDKSNQFFSNPEIELNPGDKFFTLNFSLLDYESKSHMFAWRIDGLDKEWNFQRENSLRLNSLPHGNYTLEIKAKGLGGNWAKNQLSIPIIVKQAFYKSWLFLFFCGVLLLSILYLGYRVRLMRLTQTQTYLENEVAERTTEINKQNLMLKKLNYNKDQFFSIIGHDLRGPLLSLRGVSKKVNFLINQNRLEEINKLGERIEDSTMRVTKLLDNLLNWALIQKEEFPYYPEELNLTSIVTEVFDIYHSVADIKNISLKNLTEVDHFIFVDRNAISTIIRNLIDNALKFTDQGGKIEVKSTIDQAQILLMISDTGIGIPSKILPTIFELSADRKKLVQGTGLGLVLCKDLIELNKGSIHVESELKKGTQFLVKIPRFIENNT